MKKLLLAALLLLIPTIAHGGTHFKYGLGVFNTAEVSAAASKYFSLGYQSDLIGPFIEQWELGLFSDSSGSGRNASGFGFYSIGVEVNPGYFVSRCLWGIGGITHPDQMLGGHFQFTQDLMFGIRDRKKNMIGFVYKHISSAGIYQPNRGRDYVLVQVEIPW
mgnify:CR=1 FL=1